MQIAQISRIQLHNQCIHVGTLHQQQGKMNYVPLIFTAVISFCVCKDLAINMIPELKKNVLNLGYGVNFKYFLNILTDFMW